MDSHNLAVVIGPTLFPTEEKLGVTTTNRLTKIRELIQVIGTTNNLLLYMI